jgi:4-hydroxybenzoate polyprenyltransferase
LERLKIYAELTRLNRPVGTLLLLWPTLAALWMASAARPDLRTVGIFALGTLVMRSGGCVVNDIVDRNVDPYVERTRNRPLARRAISVAEAAILAIVLFAIAGGLALLLKPTTLIWAAGGAALAATYPFAKRFTYLPQAVLGIAFSWGILLAFIEVQGSVPPPAWIFFVGSLLWIIAYDTIYAMADRDDDIQIGVKSTAVLFGDGAMLIVVFLQVCTLLIWLLVGDNMAYHYPYYLSIGAAACLFVWQQQIVRVQPSLHGDEASLQRAAYINAFTRNVWVGFALFLGMVAERELFPLGVS